MRFQQCFGGTSRSISTVRRKSRQHQGASWVYPVRIVQLNWLAEQRSVVIFAVISNARCVHSAIVATKTVSICSCMWHGNITPSNARHHSRATFAASIFTATKISPNTCERIVTIAHSNVTSAIRHLVARIS